MTFTCACHPPPPHLYLPLPPTTEGQQAGRLPARQQAARHAAATLQHAPGLPTLFFKQKEEEFKQTKPISPPQSLAPTYSASAYATLPCAPPPALGMAFSPHACALLPFNLSCWLRHCYAADMLRHGRNPLRHAPPHANMPFVSP